MSRWGDAWGETDADWAVRLVAPFPMSWLSRLLDRWDADRLQVSRRDANLGHLLRVRQLGQAHAAGVPLDAGDAELCEVAAQSARDMETRLQQRDIITRGQVYGPGDAVSPWSVDWRERCALLAGYAEAAHWLGLRGLGDVAARWRGPLVGLLRRVVCPRWWRRVLRRLYAQAVEGTARTMGLVHKRAGCYVSDDTARRRAAQLARNAATLEHVTAMNESGQTATLAELAAKGAGNRQIRRMELMTRIAGFERIAKECGHVAYFVTLTCPSRMHAWRTAPGRRWAVEKNPRFDGTTPDAAQRYLTQQWARFRAAADRAGLHLYGFRITEPNHDGTPHWHCLLFFPAVASRRVSGGCGAVGDGDEWGGVAGRCGRADRPGYRVAVRLLRRYFLHAVDGVEPGARKHRVKVERIDWARGTAAGYVAKYVAKNIDGYRVEKDLYGNDCLHASQRVDAWASTWRVRQFQQVGGAPVGVWRELRRLNPEQGEAAPGLALFLDAVNVAGRGKRPDDETDIDHQQTAADGWAAYTEMQGGARVRRADLRVRLMRECSGEVGRYGDPVPARAVGVVTVDTITEHRPALGIVKAYSVRRRVVAEVESERSRWVIVGASDSSCRKGDAAGVLGGGLADRPAPLACAEGARPWSPVNNCTRAIDAARVLKHAGALDQAPGDLFPLVKRWPKLGRWHDWGKRPSEGRRAPAELQGSSL